MPLKPIFLSGRLASLPRRLQEQSASSEDGIESVLSDFDDDTGKLIELYWVFAMFVFPKAEVKNSVAHRS